MLAAWSAGGQTVSVPAGAQYLNVDVTLTNTTSQALTDVYYGRGVDADNCRTAQTAVCDSDGDGVADSDGVYETFNQVRSQLTTGDSVAAVSSDQTDGSYIDLR